MHPSEPVFSPSDAAAATQAPPIRQSAFVCSPAQMRAAAHLYRVESVPVERARVLEIGCGAGERLLAFAQLHPQAEVVGVDASAEDIGRGRAHAQRLGLDNLRLHAMSALDIAPDFGRFDYIVMQDVYGRVPADAGQALLAICKQNLSDRGLAFVNYDTLPGWRGADVVRDALLLHGASGATVQDQIARARAMLSLIGDGMASDNPLAGIQQTTVARLKACGDDELYAFLNGSVAARYFVEFADAAGSAGLAYVGDGEPQTEIPLSYGGQVSLHHSLLSLGQPKLTRQQYLDFAVGRQVRGSLLVHGERAQECSPSPDLAQLAQLRFAGRFMRSQREKVETSAESVYVDPRRRTFATRSPEAKAVVQMLSLAWPGTLGLDELASLMPGSGYRPMDELRGAVQQAIEAMFRAGVLRYSVGPSAYDQARQPGLALVPGLRDALPDRLAAGEYTGVNLWQDPIQLKLDEVQAALLPALDGRASIEELVDRWTQIEGGAGARAAEPGEQAAGALRKVLDFLEALRRQGALMGSGAAWVAYFGSMVQEGEDKALAKLSYLDPLIWSRNRQYEGMSAAERRKANTVPVALGREADRFKELRNQMRYDDAASLAREMTGKYPDYGLAWQMLGRVLTDLADYDEAMRALKRAVCLRPLDAAIHGDIAGLLHARKQYKLVEICTSRALRIKPDVSSFHNTLGNALKGLGNHTAALACLLRAVELDPKSREAHTNLGNVYGGMGDHIGAEQHYRRALELAPDYFLSYSNLLFSLIYRSDLDPQEIFREHRAFGERARKKLGAQAPAVHGNSRDPDRKLRLGFVSGDLRNHAVMNFLEPVWQALDKSAFELYVYSTSDREDAHTERVKPLAASWQVVTRMSDAKLADTIRADGVDILFDLSGHTALNRLPAFALKPAPVQVTWIGYPGTTGLAEMDYYLIDRHVAPPGWLDAQFTEKLVYVPSSGTFLPHPDAPPVNDLPALGNGYLTFGSFNRYSKISEPVLALWARVLQSLPDSRMLLGWMGDAGLKADVTQRFARYGVDAGRLEFRPRAGMRDYLGFHHQVDIALDTFPYTGGTTTSHALWMGVPVLTMRGRTRVECQSTGVLGRAGLEEWIAVDQDDFHARAVSWAGRLPELQEVRMGMRHRLESAHDRSPATVTRGIEAAMRQMWRRWCDGLPPESFLVQ